MPLDRLSILSRLTLLAIAMLFAPTAGLAGERIGARVAGDIAAGASGNHEALERAIAACEAALAANPNDAEALAWHGAGLLARAGMAFRAGDFSEGGAAWSEGTAELDRAVAIAPDDVTVRLVRGGTCLAASRHFPSPDVRRGLLKKGVEDYERVLALTPNADCSGGPASKGAVLLGLADAWERLGDADRSKACLERVTAECHGTEPADAARQKLGAGGSR